MAHRFPESVIGAGDGWEAKEPSEVGTVEVARFGPPPETVFSSVASPAAGAPLPLPLPPWQKLTAFVTAQG